MARLICTFGWQVLLEIMITLVFLTFALVHFAPLPFEFSSSILFFFSTSTSMKRGKGRLSSCIRQEEKTIKLDYRFRDNSKNKGILVLVSTQNGLLTNNDKILLNPWIPSYYQTWFLVHPLLVLSLSKQFLKTTSFLWIGCWTGCTSRIHPNVHKLFFPKEGQEKRVRWEWQHLFFLSLILNLLTWPSYPHLLGKHRPTKRFHKGQSEDKQQKEKKEI